MYNKPMRGTKNSSLVLSDNQGCFACGAKNPHGLRMSFKMLQSGEMESEFVPDARFQGFEGILHGGIMALLLDEIMVNLAWKNGLNAVSAELKVRLKKPVPIGQKIILRARIAGQEKRLVRTTAEARLPDGTLAAEAEAACIQIKDR